MGSFIDGTLIFTQIFSCKKCYSPTDELLDGRTAMELREKTKNRILAIKAPNANGECIQVEEIWCEINTKNFIIF